MPLVSTLLFNLFRFRLPTVRQGRSLFAVYCLLFTVCFPYILHRQLQKRLARPIARFNRVSHLNAIFNGGHSFSALPPDRLEWAAFRSSNEHLEMPLSN